MQLKYRNQFHFLSTMKKQGRTQNKAKKSFQSNIVLTFKENNSECMW